MPNPGDDATKPPLPIQPLFSKKIKIKNKKSTHAKVCIE